MVNKTAIFVDTSAFYALLVAEDRRYTAARKAIEALARDDAALVTSSLVLHETVALLQARIGVHAVRRFCETIEPMLDIVWIDRVLYDRARAALLAANLRQVSLTDWSSFELMRSRGLHRAFAFDADFQTQGFEIVP